jgi:glutathione S-transferase
MLPGMEATDMKLYFHPLACALATRIALYEAGAHAEFVQVDNKTKLTLAGADFRRVNPLGMVPALELASGEVICESAAVLQYVARRFPTAKLAPSDDLGQARLQQLLCFIGTELHKLIYVPLMDHAAPAAAKEYALGKVALRFDWLEQQLSGKRYLLADFSIADAYLFAVLNWTLVTPIQLEHYPALRAFRERMLERPSVARAFQEELILYREEQALKGQPLPPVLAAS